MYRRSTRQRLALLALVAAAATIVTLDFRENPGGPIHRIQDAAISILAPIQDGIVRAFRPVGDFLSGLGELPTLRDENRRLRTENERLEEQQRRIPDILRENQSLLALLAEKDWASGASLGARVISGVPSNLEASRLLNKGSADGVKEGMAVTSSEGLVGRIVLVAPQYSKVLLAIDPHHSAGARLTNSGETGVVTGRGDEDLRFELIDPTAPVSLGETVVTSGYDQGVYPPGIPIGRVTKVEPSKDGLSKNAYVSPFVDFSRLDMVRVMLESGPTPGQ
jgi:rod shape-determining protein MreC